MNEELFDKVMKIINEWDPISLIAVGAPEHEYGIEIDHFLPLLMKAEFEEYPEILNHTFEKYFEGVYKRNQAEVKEVAKKLYDVIKDSDITA